MPTILDQLSASLAVFSVISLLLLILQNRIESTTAKNLANVLLLVLVVIQILQGLYALNYVSLKYSLAPFYLLALGLVGPLFYLYSQHVIFSERTWSTREIFHIVPVVIIVLLTMVLPALFSMAYALMFFLGGLYMLQLIRSLYQLRRQRTLFKMEFMFATVFLGWAILVVILGLFGNHMMTILIPAHITMLAIAIATALHMQLNYPHLLSTFEEIANRQYQSTTLSNVDINAINKCLDELMAQKVFQDSGLSLSSLADMLELKPHQLSELLNTQLNTSFSSFLRKHRILEATTMLESEPNASVLAIGLAVGFSSQSAFYTAFKAIHSMSPGQYRRSKTSQ